MEMPQTIQVINKNLNQNRQSVLNLKKHYTILKILGNEPENKIIPYKSIYNPPLKFRSLQRKVFMPDVEITVRIIDNERSFTTHLLNPNL